MTACFVHICQIFAESSQFCKCKFQVFASFLIEKMQIENVQHPLFGFASFHPSISSPSIFIPYYLCYVHRHEKSSNHFTPVIVIIFYSSYHPRIMHKIMYIRASYLFVSRVVARSVLFILHPPDLRGGRSVLARHLSTSLHTYVCM